MEEVGVGGGQILVGAAQGDEGVAEVEPDGRV